MYYLCFDCGGDEPLNVVESSLEQHRNHKCAPSVEFAKCNKCGFFILSNHINESCGESGCSGMYKPFT